MSGAHRRDGRPVVLALMMMVGVLALVLLVRPEEPESPASRPAPTDPSVTGPSLPTPSEEKFCAGFRRLAASQSEYAAAPDQRGVELLRAAADDLVDLGVPATMSLPARGGYHTVVAGIYDSIGLSLERAAVGAPDEPVANEDAAFSSFLAEYCPA